MPRHTRAFGCLAALLVALPAVAQVKMPQLAVYVEDSQAAQDLLDQAKTLIEQKRVAEAAAVYRKVMEEYPTKLARTGEKMYADVRRRVLADVARDSELLEAYRRLEEPGAQRALTAACTPVPNRTAIEIVVGRYLPCPSGLEAGLRLAAMYLESACPDDAASVLDELQTHPDLKSQAARWHLLQAGVGVFADDKARLEKHTAALRELKDEKSLATLETWSRGLKRPVAERPINPAQQQVEVTPPEKLPGLLWELKLPDPLGEGVREALLRNNGLPDGTAPPSMHPVPVVHGNRLLINNGAAAMALDRDSGRVLWSYTGPEAAAAQFNPLMRMTGPIADQRSVMLDGQRVVTVMGFALPMNMNWQVRGTGTSLVCLRESDGQLLWRVEPSDGEAAPAGAYFHGTPIADHDRILVMARRNQGSGFQDAYVMALDAQSGKAIWTRYLSSAIATSRGSSSPMSQMLLSRGRLYISDNLGSVSCVESRSGAVVWLAVMPAQASEIDMAFGRPRRGATWDTPAPMLVDAGLIVPSLDINRPAQLLNPDTGEHIRELTEAAWSDANALFAVKQGILCVGSTMHLLDAKTLEERWSRRVTGAERSEQFRGRAAVTSDRVLLPMRNKIVALNLTDGTEAGQIPTDSTGSLLALDGQIVMSDGDALRSYLGWDVAYERLRAEIRARPQDPEPGLSLAAVAMSNKQSAAAVEGADAALAALRQVKPGELTDRATAEAEFQRAFDQLLGFSSTPGDASLRRSMFDRVGSIASTPAQEVAYQIAFAGFLAETNKAEEAVDHFQAVLSDPTLASQLYRRGPVAREAGMEARLRIAEIAQREPKAYEKYEALAAQRLEDLDKGSDPAKLIELARQYPLAKSAPAALLAAADALAASGDSAGAIVQLRRVYNYNPDAAVLAPAVGRLVELYVAAGRTHEARFWLEKARREHAGLQPIRGGKPIDAAAWLTELAARPTVESPLPNIATPLSQPRVIPGRLLVPIAQLEETWPRDRVLIQNQSKLELRAGSDLAAKWQAEIGAAPWTLISLTTEQAVLWNSGDARLLVLDAETGKPRWPEMLAKPLLDGVGGDAERMAAASIEERRVMELANNQGIFVMRRDQQNPAPMNYLVRANESVICLGDRAGRLVGIDRATGRILWRLLCPMDQLDGLEISEDSLVMFGVTAPATEAAGGATVVLDALTGEQRGPALDDKLPALWAGLSADGLLIRATVGEITANHVNDATVAWRLRSPEPAGVVLPRSGADLLFITEPGGGMSVIQTATGKVVNRLSLPQAGPGAGGGRSAVQLWGGATQWHLASRRAAVALDAEGKPQWRDAVATPQKQFVRQMVGEKQVVLVSAIDAPAGPAAFRLNADDGNFLIDGQGHIIRLGAEGERVQNDDAKELAEKVANLKERVAKLQAEKAANPLPPVVGPEVGSSRTYKLFFLDRATGRITHEQVLGPLKEPLDAARSVFLDNMLLFSTAETTIVVQGER